MLQRAAGGFIKRRWAAVVVVWAGMAAPGAWGAAASEGPQAPGKVYDPMLAPGSRFQAAAAGERWRARWVWYPGQLAAHLHTQVSRKAFERCTHIGYPGSYRRPEHHLYLRYKTTLAKETPVRWSAPLGRVRVRVNGREGDVTIMQRVFPKGLVEVRVALDMMQSLPCLLLEGEGISTGAGWEASLDGEQWTAVECQDDVGSPSRRPDEDLDGHIELAPRKAVKLVKGKQENGEYSLEAGGEALLDFWYIELGQLSITASGQGELRVSVGESVFEAEDPDPAVAEQYPLRAIRLSGQGTAVTLPERCVRYVRLQAGGPCQITRVSLNARVYPVQYRGSFECSDARLNEIWKAGAATLHACMHDATFVDGPKRDGCIWLMDENVDFDAADCVFWDRGAVRNTVLSVSAPPGARVEEIGHFEHLFYFVLGVQQEYLASGDRQFIQRYRDRVTDVLSLFERLADQDGFISGRAFAPKKTAESGAGVVGVDWLGEFFPDWAGKSDRGLNRPTDLDTAGTPSYAQMLVMRCFEIGGEFAGVWGDVALAQRYGARAACLREEIGKTFWDEQRGAFINGFDREGKRDERLSSYAQVWGILFGLVPQDKMGPVIERVLENPDCRAPNLSMVTYWEYLAYIQAGGFDRTLELLRRHWGGLLERGDSRFGEDLRSQDDERARLTFYNRPYGLSLNHGWSGSAPVAILMRGTLGLRVLTPGYRQVELRPNWRQFEWVKCTIPTSQGELSLDYSREKGAELCVPANVQVRIVDGSQTKTYDGPGVFRP